MSDQEVPLFNTLLEAAAVHTNDAEARKHTKKFFMNCRKPSGCTGREVYFFSKAQDGSAATYQCTTCNFQWQIQTGGSFNY